MLKIPFCLKKPDTDQGSLESVIINNPKKILEGKLAGMFACEVYLPNFKEPCLIYADNQIDSLRLASEFAKSQLQFLINRGYTISEVESQGNWKLEKKDPQLYLEEKINELKNNQNISPEEKQKILNILKESFGKTIIKDQLNKAIDG